MLRTPSLDESLRVLQVLFLMCKSPFLFSQFFYLLFYKTTKPKNRYENIPWHPFNGLPRSLGPICLFSNPLNASKRHQQNLDCLHGFNPKALFPLKWGLAATYRTVCCRERHRFRTIFVDFYVSLAVGFRWIGVSNTQVQLPFSTQNGIVYSMKTN